MELFAERPALLAGDARKRCVEAETGLNRDRQEVERVRKRTTHRALALAGPRTEHPLGEVPPEVHTEEDQEEPTECVEMDRFRNEDHPDGRGGSRCELDRQDPFAVPADGAACVDHFLIQPLGDAWERELTAEAPKAPQCGNQEAAGEGRRELAPPEVRRHDLDLADRAQRLEDLVALQHEVAHGDENYRDCRECQNTAEEQHGYLTRRS